MRDRAARKILIRVPPNRFIMYSGSVHTCKLTRLITLCCMWLLPAHTHNVMSSPCHSQICRSADEDTTCHLAGRHRHVNLYKSDNLQQVHHKDRWICRLVVFQWPWEGPFVNAHCQFSLNRLLRRNTSFVKSNLTIWIHPFHFSYYFNILSVNEI